LAQDPAWTILNKKKGGLNKKKSSWGMETSRAENGKKGIRGNHRHGTDDIVRARGGGGSDQAIIVLVVKENWSGFLLPHEILGGGCGDWGGGGGERAVGGGGGGGFHKEGNRGSR